MIQAIETVYRGYKYRSRQEARWAVFFDKLGVRYEYEREGYKLPSGYYLPDFWLPQLQCFFEVKGEAPDEREQRLAAELSTAAGHWVDVVYGPIGDQQVMAYRRGEMHVCVMGLCNNCWLLAFGQISQGTGPYICGHCYNCLGGMVAATRAEYLEEKPALLAAYWAARQARFEHGERPR